MSRLIPAVCWGVAILAMALISRLGWIDRHVADSMLMFMPLLAFVTLQRRNTCGRLARGG